MGSKKEKVAVKPTNGKATNGNGSVNGNGNGYHEKELLVLEKPKAKGKIKIPDYKIGPIEQLAVTLDEKELLRVLTEVKNGNFGARMPLDNIGLSGKICDT